MRGRRERVVVLAGILALSACSPQETVFDGFGDDGRTLRVVNRQIARVPDPNGLRLSPAPGNGVARVARTDFRSGTIDVDIRGREELQQSYVGIAFHRKDDNTYEAVYLRPFYFRATDPSASSTRCSTSRCGSSTGAPPPSLSREIRESRAGLHRADRLGQAPPRH